MIGRAMLVIGGLAITGAVSTVFAPPALSVADSLPQVRTMPRYAFEEPPPTDFPRMPGARTVWFAGRPLAQLVEPGDRLVEVVAFTAGPLTAWPGNATTHVTSFTDHAPVVLLVTLDDIDGRVVDQHGAPGAWIESVARARVDRVFKNLGGTPVREGDSIEFQQQFNTGETRLGDTRVVVRLMSSRVPRRGGQYIVFLFSCAGGVLREMSDGAVEIEGSVARPMRRPNPWGGSTDAAQVLTLVAAQAARGGAFDFCGSGRSRAVAR